MEPLTITIHVQGFVFPCELKGITESSKRNNRKQPPPKPSYPRKEHIPSTFKTNLFCFPTQCPSSLSLSLIPLR